MAVNLRATATLNGKPFLATLKTLSAATAKQNKSAIKGNNGVSDSLTKQIAAFEGASKAANSGSKSLTAATGKNTRANRNLTASQAEVNRELIRTGAAQGIAIDRMSKMTAAQQRQLTSARTYSRELRRHSELVAGGLEGPAAVASAQRVERAAASVANANRAVATETAKASRIMETAARKSAAAGVAHQAKIGQALDANMQKTANDYRRRSALSARTAAAEVAHQAKIGHALDANMQKTANDYRRRSAIASAATASQAAQVRAMETGTASARTYASGLSALSQDKLKLQAATEKLGAAEGRLASSMARSNGIITPAVHAARAGVISAQQAYKNLAEAQANVGRTAGTAASGLAAQRYLYHDVSRQAAGLGVAMGAIPAAAVVIGAVWENQFANVIRTADPVLSRSTTRVDALRTSMTNMAKTMPMSFGNLTEIATLGNQMGVAANELDGFTKAVGMFSATSGIAVEEASTAFGRLRTVASDANFSFMGVADSILKVGVNSVATEKEIINVTTQISSIAAQAGFTTKEMIGLSGAMASVRIPPELSRSIITRTFTQFDRAVQKNGTELQTLARVSGRSVEDIKKNWGGPGASDIFLDFTQGLQRAGRQARVELEALGITSVRDVPALLRLSNAADSDGRRGGLLAQTLEDAHTASGEVQRQYAFMAETVVGRLKVLGNSVLSFFDTLGSSSNSFVKGAIDGLTGFFQMMEKVVDNPFSSWALGAMAALSGIALATAGVAKLTAGIKMFQHVSAVSGGASFMAAIGMSKKAGGSGELAAMSPLLLGASSAVNSFTRGAKAAGGAWANTGRVIAGTATGAFATFANAAGQGATANKALNSSLTNLSGQAPKVQGGLANLVRFGLSPVGVGLMAISAVGVFAYKEWSKGFHMTSTSVNELAESFSSIDMSNLGEISSVLRTMTISGADVWQPWHKGFKPFADGLPGLLRDLKIYTQYREDQARAEELGSHMHGGGVGDKQALRNNILAQGINPAAFKENLGNLDKSFKEMRDAGNDAGVTDFWINFGKGADSTAERVSTMKDALALMPEEAAALTTEFEIQGMSLDKGLANFGAYSRQVRDLAAEFEGTSIIADTFGLSDQEAVDFGKKMNDAASAFIDFNSAIEAGTQTDEDGKFTGFDLKAFDKDLNSSMESQTQWMNNMRTLVSTTLADGTVVSADAIQALGELGPAGKELANSLVEGLASTDPAVKAQAESTLKTFQDAVYASKVDFGPHLAEYKNVTEKAAAMLGKDAGEALNAEIAASLTPDDWSALSTGIDAVIDRHGPELGGRLGKRLFENLNDGTIGIDQFASLSNAFSTIGYNASKSLMDELDRGISMEQINARIERIQTPKIPVEFEPDSKADRQITQAFKSMFGARGVEIPASFSLESTMGELRTALGQPGLLPDIEADLTLNDIIAQGQMDGFRSWALAQGIDVELLANPSAAYLTLNSFKMVADGTITTAQLDALNEPAKGKLFEFITLASGKTAVATVDAETGLATGKIWELDDDASEPQWKPVDAKTDDAKAAIEQINAMAKAEETKNIAVTDNGTAAAVQTKINNIAGKSVTVTVNEVSGTKVEQANGGVMQFYANGGVRENHVAQIAPAGTMRVWAEPETGGEAYIPLAMSKRLRSEAILQDVATRFGYALQPQNYTQFADGGQYMAQTMSRQRFANPSVRGSGSDAGVRFGDVTFVQENNKDQFREFTRHVNRVARGL